MIRNTNGVIMDPASETVPGDILGRGLPIALGYLHGKRTVKRHGQKSRP